jgi:hypothetical protein
MGPPACLRQITRGDDQCQPLSVIQPQAPASRRSGDTRVIISAYQIEIQRGSPVYLALYARRAWVISDHPYNAEYLRQAEWTQTSECRARSSDYVFSVLAAAGMPQKMRKRFGKLLDLSSRAHGSTGWRGRPRGRWCACGSQLMVQGYPPWRREAGRCRAHVPPPRSGNLNSDRSLSAPRNASTSGSAPRTYCARSRTETTRSARPA